MSSPNDLLPFFFSACEKEFSFLQEQHDCLHVNGLLDYTNGRQIILPYHGQDFENGFRAVSIYERGRISAILTLNGADLHLSCHILVGRAYRLHLYEILKAARKSLYLRKAGFYVSNQSGLDRLVGHYGGLFRRYTPLLLDPDEHILEKAMTIRETLLEQHIRAKNEKELGVASVKAAKAFVRKDFRKVIELLKPLEDCLSRSDQKKLTIALRNILSGI